MEDTTVAKPKNDEPLRVNFYNVPYYRPRGEYTEIVFVSPTHYEQTVVVKKPWSRWIVF